MFLNYKESYHAKLCHSDWFEVHNVNFIIITFYLYTSSYNNSWKFWARQVKQIFHGYTPTLLNISMANESCTIHQIFFKYIIKFSKTSKLEKFLMDR